MTDPFPSPDGGLAGQQGLQSQTSELAAISFVVQMLLGRLWTVMPVEVVAATASGDVAPPGFVDVQPMVKQADGLGNTVRHAVIYRLPTMRLQSGATAIILDPQKGDIGVAVFSSRDISAVKATLSESQPGSFRRFDPADGIYLATILSGTTPTQYIQFLLDAINIKATATVSITAPMINLNGAVHVTGAITADSTIVATGNVTGQGTSLHTHTHGGVQVGGGNTAGPN